MNTPFDDESDRILSQAAEWTVLAQEDDFPLADARRLEQWRRAHIRHDEAYRALQAIWDDIPSMTHLATLVPLAVNDDEIQPALWGRRCSVVGGLGAVAAAAMLALVWLSPGEPLAEHYVTKIAQISKITLEDGSIATLGPGSEMDVTYSDALRKVRLARGEAFFEVARNPARPFIVETANSSVRVLGTSFNVKRYEQAVRVSVARGVVQIGGADKKNLPPALATLHGGDSAEMIVGLRGSPTLKAVSRFADPPRSGTLNPGWTTGWLVYDDARLEDIVSDLNRYYAPGVKLADPGLGNTRVTASFKADRIKRFLSSLDNVFPVSVEERADGSIQIRSSITSAPSE